MTSTMYRVCAVPELVQFGEFKGFIKHVNLAALPIYPGTDSVRQARYANDEALPGVFCDLLTPEVSADVLAELRIGHTVYLQGAFSNEQLEILGFGAESSRTAVVSRPQDSQSQVAMFPASALTARTTAISVIDTAEAARHNDSVWHHPNQAA